MFPYDGYEHLGIGYLTSVARKQGHEALLCRYDMGNYIRGYVKDFRRKAEKAAKLIANLKPDVIAFTTVSTTVGFISAIAGNLRRISKAAIIAGGAYASAEPELLFDRKVFDAVAAGECEERFPRLLSLLEANGELILPGVYSKDNLMPETAQLPDIDSIPFPAKDLFYREKPYLAKDYLIITSRGCPYKCSFCFTGSNHIAGFPSFRRRSVDSVIEELKWAGRKFNYRTVYFIDDVFTLDKGWLFKFLEEYRRHIGKPFHAVTHPQLMDAETAGELAESGCYYLRMGVQTLSAAGKKRLKREISNDKIAQAIRCVKDAGIHLETDHMIQAPDVSLDEGRAEILFYNRNRPDMVKVYWTTLLPGTKLLQDEFDRGNIDKDEYEQLRRGEQFRRRSYLYCNDGKGKEWLGIHFLLCYLTLLPKWLVEWLVRVKADRFLRIPSFFLSVGISRGLTALFHRWDSVGKTHVREFWGRLKVKG